MKHYWEPWKFETAHFTVALQIDDCLENPADCFQFDEDIAAVRNGDVAWFDARVVVRRNTDNAELGSDYLGCCAYKDVEDFYTGNNRNYYFRDMVRGAVRNARETIAIEITDQTS